MLPDQTKGPREEIPWGLFFWRRPRCATMCYMDAIGVRELRQNLSVYLDRVKEGETMRVTEHGRVVALLTPLPKPVDVLDRLVAEGKATAPTASLRNLKLPKAEPPGLPSSEELIADMREERIL